VCVCNLVSSVCVVLQSVPHPRLQINYPTTPDGRMPGQHPHPGHTMIMHRRTAHDDQLRISCRDYSTDFILCRNVCKFIIWRQLFLFVLIYIIIRCCLKMRCRLFSHVPCPVTVVRWFEPSSHTQHAIIRQSLIVSLSPRCKYNNWHMLRMQIVVGNIDMLLCGVY
jgi:hypothetical protein